MKRSTEIALVVLGAAGVAATAATVSSLSQRGQTCERKPDGTEVCRPSSSGSSSSGYSSGYRSSRPIFPVSSPGSSQAARPSIAPSRTTPSRTALPSSSSRGGFGSTGLSVSRSS